MKHLIVKHSDTAAMSFSKPLLGLAKTGRGGGGDAQDNKQVLYLAAGVAATVVTVTAGYLIYSRLYGGRSKKRPSSKDDAEEAAKTKKDAPYQALKELGNQKFKSGDYNLALENYTKAIDMLEADPEVTGEAKAQTLSMLFQNRAAVFEKLVNRLIHTFEKLVVVKICLTLICRCFPISVKLANGY